MIETHFLVLGWEDAVMRRVAGYRCTICGREFPFEPERMTCPHCGEKGILDILYDYDEIARELTRESLAACRDNSMWRYRALMPVADTVDVSRFLRIGWTPLYESLSLGRELGVKALYIKDDGLNPTASLKDRASGVAVAKAIELGYDTIACSSTGNAASSCAGSAARMGLKAVIFVPERAPEGKVAQLMIFGARVVSVHGDYKATFDLSKAAIEKYGWYNRNAGINPVMTEGKKTVALEIAEQLGWNVTDWVACSVGDGCTIGGVYNGFYDLYRLGLIERIPKILGVQSTGCCRLWTRRGRTGRSGPPRRTRWRIRSPWACRATPSRRCARCGRAAARGSPFRMSGFWTQCACWPHGGRVRRAGRRDRDGGRHPGGGRRADPAGRDRDRHQHGQRAQGREKRAARGGQAAAVRARPGRAGGERASSPERGRRGGAPGNGQQNTDAVF